MKTAKEKESIPPIRPGSNSYKPEDIKKWGVERFMEEEAPKEPFVIPDLGFTEEEKRITIAEPSSDTIVKFLL